MLTNKTLVAAIKYLIHHFVHVRHSINSAIDSNVLETKKAVVNQLQVSVVLNIMHSLVALFEHDNESLTNSLPISFGYMSFDVVLV